MTMHGFRGTHCQFAGMLAKNSFYRLDLDGISLDCRCAVGVNVVYLVRMQSTVCQRRGDGTNLSAAVWPGYMGPVTGGAITGNFCKGEPGAFFGKWAAGTISRCRISFR